MYIALLASSVVMISLSILTAIFPGETAVAGCPLNYPSPFTPGLRILLGQA